MSLLRPLRAALVAALACSALAALAQQIAAERTWPELKEETQARADRNAYPLAGLDKEEVREALSHIDSLDRDQWAAAFSAVAQRHVAAAATAEAAGQTEKAHEEYITAWRLYSFARWPTPNSTGKQKAYAQALDAFRHAMRFMKPAPQVVRIPFEGKEIVGYLRLPPNVQGRVPLVMSISALDSRKEENIERSELLVSRGVAVFAIDMPGTGEAPARQAIYGARNIDEFLAYGPRLSLQRLGLLDQPSAPMLLVNGERDTQVPIGDLDLLLHHGSPKEAWVNPTGGHVGRSTEWGDQKIYNEIVAPWLLRKLGVAAAQP